jgi:hypothetical protein
VILRKFTIVWIDPVKNGLWIAYGTGNRSRIFDECAERFYCIYYDTTAFSDTFDIPCYTEGDLGVVDTTHSSPGSHGWKFELPYDREKVVTPATYYLDKLEFSTFSPGGGTVELGPCEIGGSGSSARSYTFRIRTGHSRNPKGKEFASGIPQVPGFNFSGSGEGIKIISSGNEIKFEKTGSFTSFREHILWKDEDRD